MGSKKERSRYKPRPLAILTIPPEHVPVPGAETVRLRFFGAVLQNKVEREWRIRARSFVAASAKTGFDKAVDDGLIKRQDAPDDAPKPTPIESALSDWPADLTVSECLHSIVCEDDEIRETIRSSLRKRQKTNGRRGSPTSRLARSSGWPSSSSTRPGSFAKRRVTGGKARPLCGLAPRRYPGAGLGASARAGLRRVRLLAVRGRCRAALLRADVASHG